MAESKYKIGDIVTIKNLRDVTGSDYRFGINSDMRELSGRSFEIVDVELARASKDRVPDDGYRYTLDRDANRWSWASSMFEESSKDFIAHSVIETEDNSTDAFIKKEECPILDFTL